MTVFLTKLDINTRSREFRRDHANIHDMHRTVMSAFPNITEATPARQAHAVLWRLDSTNDGYVQYVQSRTEPDWDVLPEGHLTAPAEVRPLRPVLDTVAPGRKLAFRIVANPTWCEAKSRKRLVHREPERQVEWLMRKGEQHGFVIPTAGDVPDVEPSPIPTLVGRKNAATKITVEAVRFDGHLVVTDPEAFTEAVVAGIGRAKAYGCGLISLEPVPS
ncbi:type I-E CRISPR-associated protein Cas6/Cse3/CasE [Umezawaea sp. NPDC059074]|uniref:type I-E CRISPR-associated protein Cas6/Cse3/CasE n=1 Tax=Umezawaea sp. NPDC059074 TaxID=3346716 RepID=UPI003691542A